MSRTTSPAPALALFRTLVPALALAACTGPTTGGERAALSHDDEHEGKGSCARFTHALVTTLVHPITSKKGGDAQTLRGVKRR